jgi:glutathionylspermidine synthase
VKTSLAAGESFPPDVFRRLHRRMLFEGCKWDPQIGDVSVLAPYPLLLASEAMEFLARTAEQLSAELLAAEDVLLTQPELWRALGVPRRFREILRRLPAGRGPELRTMRFDFHPTPAGWKLSEVNADVMTGFAESSIWPRLLREADPSLHPLPVMPLDALIEAFRLRLPKGARCALIHPTSFADDYQLMRVFARALEAAGYRGLAGNPLHLRWTDGGAVFEGDGGTEKIDAILRYFPAEWLASLPAGTPLAKLFRHPQVVLANPATALLLQSKGLDAWLRPSGLAPTWNAFSPPSLPARQTTRKQRDAWIWKPMLGRNGGGIGGRTLLSPEAWRRFRRRARWQAGRYVLQEPFETTPLPTPAGPRYPCLGVFVVDGRFAGIYGRLGQTRIVDAHAEEVAVFLSQPSHAIQNLVPSCPSSTD